MIDRRNLFAQSGAAMAAGALGMIGPQSAMAKPPIPFILPAGPWQGFKTLRRAGGVLHYAYMGPDDSGLPPVVLLHKLGGWLSDWRHVAPDLAKTRKVIAFDLPGHGGSRWDGPAPYIQTLSETAALLLGALDEMDIPVIDLIGTSLGGCAAAVFGACYPERLNSLAIVSSALGGRRTLAQIHPAIDLDPGGIYGPDGMALPTRDAQLVTTFGMVNPTQIRIEGDASRQAAGLWIQPSERGVGITDIQQALSRVPIPTLLLYGEKDPAYIRFRAEAERRLANSRTEFVPNSGAFVMQDNPPETARILGAWLGSIA